MIARGLQNHAGLNGNGEVAKLRLPDLAELTRPRLPAPEFYRQWLVVHGNRMASNSRGPRMDALAKRLESIYPGVIDISISSGYI